MNIILYPHPVLRQKAKPLANINKEVYSRVDKMMELMHQANGIGLAAPQVGWSVRLFIVDVNNDRNTEKVFINPVIIEESGEVVKEEGCLSFPGLMSKVTRPQRIKAIAYNLKGQKIKIEAEGLAARVWHHELDHLNGCLFIDRLSPANRSAISSQLREFETSYSESRNIRV